MESPLFAGLADTLQSELLLEAECQTHRRGDYLYRAKEKVNLFYLLLEGSAREVYLCDTGREYLRHLATPGHFLGLHKVFSEDQSHTHHCQAVTRIKTICWQKNTVLSRCQTEPQISIRIAALLSSYYEVSCRRKCLCQRPRSKNRVARYLLSKLCNGCARPWSSDNRHWVDLRPLTYAAEEVNLSRETFSRTLKTLQEEGVIRFDSGRIIIDDIDALKNI